jgi:hypothetical protein
MKRMFGRSSATDDARPRVVYDGWPLVNAPGCPAALHLHDLLDLLQDEIDPWLAIPAHGPVSFYPGRQHLLVHPTADTPAGHLLWEQAILPRLCLQSGANVLHSLCANPPLFSPLPYLASPDVSLVQPLIRPGLISRLGTALGRGGLAGAAAVIWPDDLPLPPIQASLVRFPPFLSLLFRSAQLPLPGLPKDYLLLAGPLDSSALALFTAAWEIAAPHIGDAVSFLVSDLPPQVYQQLCTELQGKDLPMPVQNLDLSVSELRAPAFAHATALVLLGPVSPWGDLFSQALACGSMLIACETPWSDARVGQAGYLVPPDDARALAAAMLTLVNHPEVGEQIRQAARRRSNSWQTAEFQPRLLDTYRQLAQVYPRLPRTT